jgi:hypothetical protein
MKVLNKKCPACASHSVQELGCIENIPAILFPIEKEKRFEVAADDVVTATCLECGHVYLSALDIEFNSKLYNEYYYLYPYSALESMYVHYREPFAKIFDLFIGSGSGRSLLEIGCSDERQFDEFIASGFFCLGVSPGAQRGERVEMIDAFYEQIELNRTFDVVVSRFNLEHIIQPSKYLDKVFAELSPGGVFIVQVPNFQSYVKSGVLFPFAHEHPQYFNAKSLRKALERSHFQINAILDCDGPSLIAVAEKPALTWNSSDELRMTSEVLVATVNQLIELPHRKIIFYGAGLSLVGMLYSDGRLRESEKEILVVDDNPLVQGRFMPATNIEVVAFSKNLIDEDTAVILALNPIYHNILLNKLIELNQESVFFLKADGLKCGINHI